MDEPRATSTTTELAKERTVLAFERTRMSVDRTLMANLRTSLSLVSFGFTIFSFFRLLSGDDVIGDVIPEGAPARFGLALVLLGILVLAHGIWFDWATIRRIELDRQAQVSRGYMDPGRPLSRSAIQVISLLLLLLGLFVVLSMAVRVGPFA